MCWIQMKAIDAMPTIILLLDVGIWSRGHHVWTKYLDNSSYKDSLNTCIYALHIVYLIIIDYLTRKI
jgi:hypothetical protein